MIQKNEKHILKKIRDLSSAMYKHLGISSSDPFSRSHNGSGQIEQPDSTSSGMLETRAHSQTSRAHSSSRSQLAIAHSTVQDEPLELTVNKSTLSEKSKSTKKQPKTAPILQQKKLQTTKKPVKAATTSTASKRNSKSKNSTKTKSLITNLKKQKQTSPVSPNVTEGRRPRRGAAIAASAAMMAQKVLDKQLSSANVAFSDESSSEDGGEEDRNARGAAGATHESEGS